jgi:pyridoxamine 5'-phosphate oxidase
MNSEELKSACLEIMEMAEVVYVTTIDPKGYPHTRAMFNLRNKAEFPQQAALFSDHQRDFMVYLATNTSSSKLGHIKANPKVCLYYCHAATFRGLMLAGEIDILDSSEVRKALWSDGWERYYPGGPDDPDHTALRLYPKWGEGWYRGERYELGFEYL